MQTFSFLLFLGTILHDGTIGFSIDSIESPEVFIKPILFDLGLFAETKSALRGNTLDYLTSFRELFLLMEFIEKVRHLFETKSLSFYLAAVIQYLVVLKLMIVLQDYEKNVGCKLCLGYKVSFILILAEIFINPCVRLVKGIKTYHFGGDLEGSKSLIEYREALKKFCDILEDIGSFNIFYLMKSKQFLRYSKCKGDVFQI